MQAYKDKLHAALREIAECPVSMRTVEQAAAVTDLLCRLDKLEDHDEPETVEFDRATAMQWAAAMRNADGTTGPHWTMEQTTAVTMNMMYSDYYPVAVEFGLNRPEFYAALAKAFLLDKDGPGPEQKLMAYYEHIAKRSVQS